MPPDPKVHVGVCGLVTDDYGRLLVVKRVGQGPFASDGYGTWAIPGGWIEYGEDPETSVKREILEETGIIVTPSYRSFYISHINVIQGFQVITLVIECAWASGVTEEREPTKCADPQFIEIHKLCDLPLFVPTAMALKYKYPAYASLFNPGV